MSYVACLFDGSGSGRRHNHARTTIIKRGSKTFTQRESEEETISTIPTPMLSVAIHLD